MKTTETAKTDDVSQAEGIKKTVPLESGWNDATANTVTAILNLKEDNEEEKETIHIKQSVMGAFEGDTGYVSLASTPGKWAHQSNSLEGGNYGQNNFSPDYASLFAYRVPHLNSLAVVHIQGQHNHTNRGNYDTRIFYEIEATDVRKCDFKIGEIVNSLPRMTKYKHQYITGRDLDNSLQVEKIQEYDKNKAEHLAEYIMQSIINCKYLLIRLDDDKLSWKENGVLENEVARTLFAAIDMLPEKLCPLASFALSIDEKYEGELLHDKLIILYHGDKTDFGFTKKNNIEWTDLEQEPTTNYITESEKYSKEAVQVMNGRSDFFDTDLYLSDILKTLSSNLNDPKPTTDYINQSQKPKNESMKNPNDTNLSFSNILLKTFGKIFKKKH